MNEAQLRHDLNPKDMRSESPKNNQTDRKQMPSSKLESPSPQSEPTEKARMQRLNGKESVELLNGFAQEYVREISSIPEKNHRNKESIGRAEIAQVAARKLKRSKGSLAQLSPVELNQCAMLANEGIRRIKMDPGNADAPEIEAFQSLIQSIESEKAERVNRTKKDEAPKGLRAAFVHKLEAFATRFLNFEKDMAEAEVSYGAYKTDRRRKRMWLPRNSLGTFSEGLRLYQRSILENAFHSDSEENEDATKRYAEIESRMVEKAAYIDHYKARASYNKDNKKLRAAEVNTRMADGIVADLFTMEGKGEFFVYETNLGIMLVPKTPRALKRVHEKAGGGDKAIAGFNIEANSRLLQKKINVIVAPPKSQGRRGIEIDKETFVHEARHGADTIGYYDLTTARSAKLRERNDGVEIQPRRAHNFTELRAYFEITNNKRSIESILLNPEGHYNYRNVLNIETAPWTHKALNLFGKKTKQVEQEELTRMRSKEYKESVRASLDALFSLAKFYKGKAADPKGMALMVLGSHPVEDWPKIAQVTQEFSSHKTK